MIIDIKEKFSLLGRTFLLSINGVPTHRARKRFFSFLSTTRLYRNDELRITMIKEWGNVENYDILMNGGPELVFKNTSGKDAVYQCQINNNHYQMLGDRGSWMQVIKNGQIIAGWQQNDIQFNDNDYQIRTEEEGDAELLMAFCLICGDLKRIQRKRLD
jgi:hypothetical protein